jgi:hypothetical protein
MRYELTGREWAAIKPMPGATVAIDGVPHRRFVSGWFKFSETVHGIFLIDGF